MLCNSLDHDRQNSRFDVLYFLKFIFNSFTNSLVWSVFMELGSLDLTLQSGLSQIWGPFLQGKGVMTLLVFLIW